MHVPRTEHVGSLLRPAELLAAREQHEAGEMNDDQLRLHEDRAVVEVLRRQEELGLDVVTDGEQRRLSFQSQMTEAVEGFGQWDLDAFLWGDWKSDVLGERRIERPALAVVGRLVRRRWLSVAEATFALGRTDRLLKVTLPSPSLFASFWDPDHPPEAYGSLEEFLADVAAILAAEVDELVRIGVRYIQLDAPHYTLLIDEGWRSFYASRGWPADRWLELGLELDNAVIGRHPGVTFGFHLCRGNQDSRWLVEGGYEWLAQRLFPKVRAHRLLLEYDDARSGGFAPLSFVPDDKVVVLGLVSTKGPELEAPETLEARIREAGGVLPLDRLALSPQCGFATSVVGNALEPADQWAKLRCVVEAAARVWD